MSRAEPTREDYEEILGNIWLYIDWHYVTRMLTTEQKNIFADAVDASHERLMGEDFDGPIADRWWDPMASPPDTIKPPKSPADPGWYSRHPAGCAC